MPVDFEALQAAVNDAKRESEEATEAAAALTAVNEQLSIVQSQVSQAIAVSNKENMDRAASLQRIIDIVQSGL